MIKKGKRAQICAVLMAAAVSMTSVPVMAAGQTDSTVSAVESTAESTESVTNPPETQTESTETQAAASDSGADSTPAESAETSDSESTASSDAAGTEEKTSASEAETAAAAAGAQAESAESAETNSTETGSTAPVDMANAYRLYLHEDAQGGFAQGEYVVMTAPDGTKLVSTKADQPDAKSVRWVYVDGLQPDVEYSCVHYTAQGTVKDILTVNGIKTTTYTVKISDNQVFDSKQAYVKTNSYIMKESDVSTDSIHVTFQSESAHGWGGGIGSDPRSGVIPGSNLFRAFEDTYASDGAASSYGYDYSRQNQYGYVQGKYGTVRADKYVVSYSIPKGEAFGLLPLEGKTSVSSGTGDSEIAFAGWYDAKTGKKITDSSVGYDGAVYVARFKETGKAKFQVFKDITPSHELYKAANWGAGSGIIDTSNRKFNPDRSATRAEVITFLYRQFGKSDTASTTKTPFRDVKSKAYYAKAVAWAYRNGYTTGTSKNKFSPNRKCTRGEFLTFLQRICPAYYNFSGLYGGTINSNANPFADVTDSTPYAQMVEYLVDRNIMFGLPGDTLNAKKNVTRGEVLSILYRMDRQETLR